MNVFGKCRQFFEKNNMNFNLISLLVGEQGEISIEPDVDSEYSVSLSCDWLKVRHGDLESNEKLTLETEELSKQF